MTQKKVFVMENISENQEIKQFYGKNYNGYSKSLQKRVEFVEFSKDKIVAKLLVTDEDTNIFGTLHGGAIAFLSDTVSTAGILVHDLRLSLSVELSVRYIKPIAASQTITIESNILKRGKTLAFADIRFFDQDGVLSARASHTKFFTAKKASL
eukprot:TRINITY_DN2159_c0_g1_i1.p1 TRINITY_DN2159_c0_g1~~TRINITY_DN2159_c0_g1_i1.p1  ORF type:complete len:153 (+),score=28.33 TRINITY_DN2159_c0_g1_i1:285-743(+)